jgi:hypothetical protein
MDSGRDPKLNVSAVKDLGSSPSQSTWLKKLPNGNKNLQDRRAANKPHSNADHSSITADCAADKGPPAQAFEVIDIRTNFSIIYSKTEIQILG